MKPTDDKKSTCIYFEDKSNDKDPKFKIGGRVRISKYKSIFAKGYTANWSENIFVLKKVKSIVPWAYSIDLNVEQNIGAF